jgi:perosamine synthetase
MERIFMAGPWITEHEVRTVEDAMRNGWYEHAYDYCEAFEKEFARFHNRKYALMTPNCTSAIHLLLSGLGITDGDEVIAPECTWIATAAPISYRRAKPVFCDIDPVHWCMDPASAESYITPRTKAIIFVDIFGNMPRVERLQALCDKYGLYLIEDSAEALGSRYRDVPAGKFGVGSVFSFHRTKTITTGEGGMLLVDDDRLFERCKFLRDHGRVEGIAYYNSEVAYKYMPFNVQAALGYAQFQRLQELVDRKREIFRLYKERLQDIEDLQFNDESDGVYNSVWITGLTIGKSHNMSKKEAMERLETIGVPSRPFFYPLTSLPAYPEYREEDYRSRNPVAYDISSRGINLPGAFNLTEEQIDFVCDGVRKILGR